MTRADHATGTDRVAEVAARLERARLIVNLQGDEPEISGAALDRVVALLDGVRPRGRWPPWRPRFATSRFTETRPAWLAVACSAARGGPSITPRSPIPFHRDGLPDASAAATGIAYLHLGLYAYRRDFLLALASLPPSPLEAAEKLEQLRVLDAGFPIAVGIVDEPSVGIDTPEDYRRFVARWRKLNSAPGV